MLSNRDLFESERSISYTWETHPTSNYPCLKIVILQLAYIPELTITIISAKSIYLTHIKRLPETKIVTEQPTLNWRKIWYNIGSRQLTSLQRSMFYLLVHNKMQHGQLLQRIQRSSATCQFCMQEDTGAHWSLRCALECLQLGVCWQKPSTKILPGITLSFLSFRFPELCNIGWYYWIRS